MWLNPKRIIVHSIENAEYICESDPSASARHAEADRRLTSSFLNPMHEAHVATVAKVFSYCRGHCLFVLSVSEDATLTPPRPTRKPAPGGASKILQNEEDNLQEISLPHKSAPRPARGMDLPMVDVEVTGRPHHPSLIELHGAEPFSANSSPLMSPTPSLDSAPIQHASSDSSPEESEAPGKDGHAGRGPGDYPRESSASATAASVPSLPLDGTSSPVVTLTKSTSVADRVRALEAKAATTRAALNKLKEPHKNVEPRTTGIIMTKEPSMSISSPGNNVSQNATSSESSGASDPSRAVALAAEVDSRDDGRHSAAAETESPRLPEAVSPVATALASDAASVLDAAAQTNSLVDLAETLAPQEGVEGAGRPAAENGAAAPSDKVVPPNNGRSGRPASPVETDLRADERRASARSLPPLPLPKEPQHRDASSSSVRLSGLFFPEDAHEIIQVDAAGRPVLTLDPPRPAGAEPTQAQATTSPSKRMSLPRDGLSALRQAMSPTATASASGAESDFDLRASPRRLSFPTSPGVVDFQRSSRGKSIVGLAVSKESDEEDDENERDSGVALSSSRIARTDTLPDYTKSVIHSLGYSKGSVIQLRAVPSATEPSIPESALSVSAASSASTGSSSHTKKETECPTSPTSSVGSWFAKPSSMVHRLKSKRGKTRKRPLKYKGQPVSAAADGHAHAASAGEAGSPSNLEVATNVRSMAASRFYEKFAIALWKKRSKTTKIDRRVSLRRGLPVQDELGGYLITPSAVHMTPEERRIKYVKDSLQRMKTSAAGLFYQTRSGGRTSLRVSGQGGRPLATSSRRRSRLPVTSSTAMVLSNGMAPLRLDSPNDDPMGFRDPPAPGSAAEWM